jgi:hypothetical protein
VNLAAAIILAATSLHITVWPNGHAHSPKRTYTLACAPLGGTLPHRRSACARLAGLERPFAPTPRQIACTQIYGGPQEALVTGRFRGRTIRSSFNRRNGCEIDRWNRVAFLFPQ